MATTSKVTLRTKKEAIERFRWSEKPTTIVYRERTEADEHGVDEGNFAAYRPQRIVIEGAKPHPDRLVESIALSCVKPPMPVAQPKLPPSLVTEGHLSEAQVEAIIYAADAHERMITVSNVKQERKRVRRGWMSGYGTGVGKGRVTSGIILSNFAEGRTKAIWLSESSTLEEDARRDWKALTGNESAIFTLEGVPLDAKLERPEGILFMTYATLRSVSRSTPRSRLDQVVEWLGEDFDGVIVFDESHNLANAMDITGERGIVKGSKQGISALELQWRLPIARIVYNSATAASKIEALAYAPRLGLWGDGTAFPDCATFMARLSEGGTAAFELLCRDMKSLGMYLSASLSYDGVTFERLVHRLSPEQVTQYNALAGAWRIIYEHMEETLKTLDAEGRARGAFLSQIESSRIRSLQAMTVTQKMPTVIADIEARLKDGHAVVLQLTNTNEAGQERALARMSQEDDLEDLDLSPKDMVLDFIDRAYPIHQHYTRITADGSEVCEMMTVDGEPVVNPAAVADRERLKTQLVTLMVPKGPLEMLLDHFGIENVSEVTGRGRRVVFKTINGVRTRVVEERGKHANSAETTAFMDDTKRILLFSEAAGGTGRSYHASRTCKNQRRRFHYLLQTGWRSDRAMQGMGRTHRTNQAHQPHYILCVTDIPGEMRFTSVIARRLESLGALTRGQRDASGTSLFRPEDNLETNWGNEALATYLRRLASGLPQIPYGTWVAQTNLPLMDGEGKVRVAEIPMNRFLNRVLACDLGEDGGIQGLILNGLLEQIEMTIEQAKRNKSFDHGIQTLQALSMRKLDEVPVHTDPATGAATTLVTIEATMPVEVSAFGSVLGRMRSARERYNPGEVFFAKHPDHGIVGIYPTAASTEVSGRLEPMARMVSPTMKTAIQARFILSYNRDRVSDDEAHDLWIAALEHIPTTRTEQKTMIAGCLLPIYDRLPAETPLVYRITFEDGERLIGRLVDEASRTKTFAALGLNVTDTRSPYEILASEPIELTNGYRFKRSRLNGITRIEVTPPSTVAMASKGTLIAKGVLCETIDYRLRFFIPTGPREREIFEAVVNDVPLAMTA